MTRFPRFILLANCFLFGCSAGGPATLDVSGVITLDGKPVANAIVGFIPGDNANDIKPAHGTTDGDGRYTLRTYLKPGLEAAGAMPGSFKVVVSEGSDEHRIIDYEELAKQQRTFSAEYADAQTTPLSASVTEAGDNTFDFQLKAPK